jgi:hypothetical protein
MESTVKLIVEALEQHQFSYNNEWELQAGIAKVLTETGLEFKKEVKLGPKQRIDFLLPEEKIGIEVKIDGALGTVTRQLWHYMDSDQIEAVILVTTRHVHQNLPLGMKGKLLRVVYLLNL